MDGVFFPVNGNSNNEFMFSPSKNKFEKDLNKIKNDDIKEAVKSLYDHLTGETKIFNVNTLIENVLYGLFNSGNSNPNKKIIPVSFLDTTMAEVIFLILYCKEEKKYTVRDLRKFSVTEIREKGYSKEAISAAVEAGQLDGEIKDYKFIFTESQIISFLKIKGYSDEHIKKALCYSEEPEDNALYFTIPDKNEYVKEVEKLPNKSIAKDLKDIYEHLIGRKVIPDINDYIKTTLCKMYDQDTSAKSRSKKILSVNSLKNIVIKTLLSIMYCKEEKLYTTKDITLLTQSEQLPKGYHKQFLLRKRQEGVLEGITRSDGKILYTAKQVFNFLNTMNFFGRKCSEPGCPNPFYAKNYCQNHYRLKKRQGLIK